MRVALRVAPDHYVRKVCTRVMRGVTRPYVFDPREYSVLLSEAVEDEVVSLVFLSYDVLKVLWASEVLEGGLPHRKDGEEEEECKKRGADVIALYLARDVAFAVVSSH